MRTITSTTNKGKEKITGPESWDETTTGQFQDLIRMFDPEAGETWAKQDWCKMFSITYKQDYDTLVRSTDYRIADALHECISYIIYSNVVFEELSIPKQLDMRPVWSSDDNDTRMMTTTITDIPKELGRLSVGQLIQARKSTEDLKDLREGLSMITAIFLQPLIDSGRTDFRGKPIGFDMLRVIEIEAHIQKMSIVKIFPIGFFLLRRLSNSGPWHIRLWNRIKNYLRIRSGRT